MAGICFHFEPDTVDVFSGREQDIHAWIYAAQIPGDITDMVMINSSGWTPKGLDGKFNWKIVPEMPDLPGRVTYLVTDKGHGGDLSLWNFNHKTDWYAFGPAGGWGDDRNGVNIPQANPLVALHALHIAPTVMFDRWRKI